MTRRLWPPPLPWVATLVQAQSIQWSTGEVLLNGNVGGDSFSIDAYYGGVVAPQIAGELSAWADISYVEVFDHYEQVYSHDEQVLDYCETEDPFTCYYRSEPVYIEQPVHRYESDLGEGQIYLTSIDVQTHVVAVQGGAL
ncbi:MAG: hypothetical protein WAQ08_13275 [Aquabacterium sp.]|uniref:hypothetical protein n=1 Tax=Aquabacterium sp. TaxID=1872578 RepID=UPI003BAF908E